MKDYIYQFYNEGLATTFYLKPLNFINKKFKNKKLVKILKMFIQIIYTVLVLIFAGYMFLESYPF